MRGENPGQERENREREEKRGRRTGVDRGARVFQLERLVSKLDLFELDLPVTPPPHGDILDLALEVLLVDATKDGLALLGVGTHPEREHGFIEEALVEHVVEGGDDVRDRDGVVAETENAV